METFIANSGDLELRPGQIKPPALVKAECALKQLQDIMRKMQLVGVEIPGEMLALEPIRQEIVRIQQGRALHGMTPNCRGYRAADLQRLMTNQMTLELKLGWLTPKHPLARRMQ